MPLQTSFRALLMITNSSFVSSTVMPLPQPHYAPCCGSGVTVETRPLHSKCQGGPTGAISCDGVYFRNSNESRVCSSGRATSSQSCFVSSVTDGSKAAPLVVIVVIDKP